jgi:hypothetical protein
MFAAGVTLGGLTAANAIAMQLEDLQEDADTMITLANSEHMTDHLMQWLGEDPAALKGASKTLLFLLAFGDDLAPTDMLTASALNRVIQLVPSEDAPSFLDIFRRS